MRTPRILLVTGFLGAGKTTLIAALARLLEKRGEAVAVVTNDQSGGLVDTAHIAALGVPVREVSGACFCCALPDLDAALASFLDDVATRATVVLAEPVGSCTDVVATVVRPLERRFADRVRLLPLVCLVDDARIRERGASSDVDYLVDKQLEEADVICVSKSDRLTSHVLAEDLDALEHRYADRVVTAVSCDDDSSVAALFDALDRSDAKKRWLRDIDYARYAAAEAALGWVNVDFALTSDAARTCAEVARVVVEHVATASKLRGGVVGHIKARVTSNGSAARAHAASTSSDVVVVHERNASKDETHRAFEVRVNARVTIAPDALLDAIENGVRSLGNAHVTTEPAAFRPSAPRPTERIVGV